MEAEQVEELDILKKEEKAVRELKKDLRKLKATYKQKKEQIEKELEEKIHFTKGVQHCLRETEMSETKCPQLQEKFDKEVGQMTNAIKKLENDKKELKREFEYRKVIMREELKAKENTLKEIRQNRSQTQKSAIRRRTRKTDNTKSCFNYLLLDPAVTQDLRQQKEKLSPQNVFERFKRAIFYIGKGQQGRPYDHLCVAKHHLQLKTDTEKLSPKTRRIQKIWSSGNGVISLHCFHHARRSEALNREAYMIEAVGTKRLTNKIRGSYEGNARMQHHEKRKAAGERLLNHACIILLCEGEVQIGPQDIK